MVYYLVVTRLATTDKEKKKAHDNWDTNLIRPSLRGGDFSTVLDDINHAFMFLLFLSCRTLLDYFLC